MRKKEYKESNSSKQMELYYCHSVNIQENKIHMTKQNNLA